MAEITKNIGLVKPEENDFYDIHIQNQNTDKIDAAIANKVAKEAGKGLSEENYTAAEKAKLTGVEEKANHYLHPAQHAAGMIAYEDNKGIGGSDLQTVIDIVTDRVMNQLVEKSRIVKNFTTAEEGYVADATLVKELNDRVVEQNNNLDKKMDGIISRSHNANSGGFGSYIIEDVNGDLNLPSTGWYALSSIGDSNTCVQTAIGVFNTKVVYYRSCTTGNWSSWKANPCTNDIPYSSIYFDLNAVGWYKVAQFKTDTWGALDGGANYSVDIAIKTTFGYNSPIFARYYLLCRYKSSSFLKMASTVDNGIPISQMRHTIDKVNNVTYLEVYYNVSKPNGIRISLSDAYAANGFKWEAIQPVLQDNDLEVYSITNI